MRTTLNLPNGLIDNLMALTGKSQKTQIVVAAMHAYERALRREKLLRLRGRAKLLVEDFNAAALRDAETDER
jgi:hypothetical protein